MQSFLFPKRLVMPLWSWFARIFGFCISAFFLVFSIWTLTWARHPFGWAFFVFLLFIILLDAIKGVRELLVINGIVLLEDGLQKRKMRHDVSYRWEEVTRYEPYRLDFALFFKNGEKIRFPVEIKDSKEIKTFILEKLQQIGKFEDGRNVPRVLASIPTNVLLWIIAAIVLVIVVVVAFMPL
jgi:hypothetical protein